MDSSISIQTKVKNKFGTYNVDLGNKLLNQAVSSCMPPDKRNPQDIRAVYSVFEETNVQSPVEAMLLSQILAVHTQIMRTMAYAQGDCSLSTQETLMGMANKLMRTFSGQVEAYEKFRRGGKQSIKVDHVHVHEGAQAIVGNVNHGHRGV